jgi:hypothetical protein
VLSTQQSFPGVCDANPTLLKSSDKIVKIVTDRMRSLAAEAVFSDGNGESWPLLVRFLDE